MLQVFPRHVPVASVREAFADVASATDRPSVRIVMVQSIDGTIAIDGRSGGLGGPADREVYLANRSLADVVLVGAETVRAEGYGPARLTPELVAARRTDGMTALPPIAVISRSLNLDWDAAFFAEATERPIIITTQTAPAAAVYRAGAHADVIVAGEDSVDIGQAIAQLGRRGAALVVCEGGPTLNAHLATAGLIDELCLSIAPQIAGGAGARLVNEAELTTRHEFSLHATYVQDDFIFVRYRAAMATRP